MRLSFLTTGWLRGPDLLLRPGGGWRWGALPMTMALLERPSGILLVDTGFCRRASLRPREFPGLAAQLFLGLRMRPGDDAASQLRAAGYDPRDVRDVVLTHLHIDHAGGLEDFPEARVHVASRELARGDRRVLAVLTHGIHWAPFAFVREAHLGFPAARDLFGDGSVVALDAAGHTPGHTAVALRAGGEVLVHAGDAVLHLDEARLDRSCLLQQIEAADRTRAVDTRRRLAELWRGGVAVVPSHDLEVFERLEKLGRGSPAGRRSGDLEERREPAPPPSR